MICRRGSGGVYQIVLAKQCSIMAVCVMWIIMGILQNEPMYDCTQIVASGVKLSKQGRENLKMCVCMGWGVTDI